MNTSKREVINSFRKKIQERSADSTYTNKDLYLNLMDQAKWLIKREIVSGRIYSNTSFFQTLGCQEVIEVPVTDSCCPVRTNCKIYRTKNKIPALWIDNKGPVVRTVTSVDGTTEFMMISPTAWQNKRGDPYQQMSEQKYYFPANDYFWFPENNPHRINIDGFWTDDVTELNQCHEPTTDCHRWLDTPFPLPDWLHAEMVAKALQQLFPSKQMQEDNQIDKNPTRKD